MNHQIIAKLAGNNVALGSAVYFFKLQPVTDADTPWKLSVFDGQSYQTQPQQEAFDVEFISDVSGVENVLSQAALNIVRNRQQCIFVVEFEQQDGQQGDWRFWKKGIYISAAENPYEYNIEAEIVNQGKALVLYIDSVKTTTESDALYQGSESLDFRFTAIRLNKAFGGTFDKVYYSQDPIIRVKRPPGV